MIKPYHRAYLAAFLMDLALMVGNTALPFYIYQRLAGGPAMSGGIGAATTIGYALACLLSAPYVHRARNGLVWAITGGLLYAVLFAAACGFGQAWLFAALVTIGFGGLGLYWPALQSWLGAEPDPVLRRRHIAMYNISWSAGLAVGALLGGPLFDIDYRLPFVAVFLAAMSAVGLILSLPREDMATEEEPVDDATAVAEADVLSEGHMASAWAANLTGFILVGASLNVFPKRVEELCEAGQMTFLFGHGPVEILGLGAATVFAWLVFAMSLARAITFYTMGRTQCWHHRYWVLFVLQCVAAGSMWIMSFSQSLVIMALCFLVIGVNGGTCFFASIYYSLANRGRKHRRAAINESMVGIGSSVGALGFGLVAKHMGVTWPFFYAFTIIGAGIVAQLWLLRRGLRGRG